MSTIDVSFDTADLERFQREAAALGIDAAEFEKAANKAVTTTTRTLQRVGLSNIAKSVGARPALLRKHSRILAPKKGGAGLLWFGLDPVSLSSFSNATIRQVPKGFRIKKLGSSVWQRPPRSGLITANVPEGFASRVNSFRRKAGRPDVLLKLYRKIETEGATVVENLTDDATPLLNKNFRRELDQIIRKRRFAGK